MRASSVVTLLLIGLVSFAGLRAADADPNKAFAGQIKMSDKRFPQQAKSPAAFVAKIKSMSKVAFYENKETKSWKIFLIGFLKSPLGDLEYLVKIYDVTGRQQQMLASFEQFTDERGQKTLTSNITLDRKQFGVNRELMITMESKGKVLASGRFKILGEGEKFNGKVDFSKDDEEEGN